MAADAEASTRAQIGPYRVSSRLGEGAASVVYRAATAQGGEVALKVFRPELAQGEVFRSRLAQEVRAAREVRHPHLVPLLDAGEDAGLSYIAFAYAPGSESLAVRIGRGGPLTERKVTRLASEVGSALDALHNAGIIHRDVKPSNIILDGESALLTDFGLAKGAAYAALTRPGQILGTADYLAPELIRGGPATPASDLYAFGCTLYECVVGAPPFAGRTVLAVGMAQLGEHPADPTQGRPGYAPDFGRALLAALAKDPAARPSGASSYARLLAQYASAAGGPRIE